LLVVHITVMSLALLLFTLLLIGAQAQVYFNSTYNCTQGCSIIDPAIYVGNLLPTPYEKVIFNITGVDASLFAPPNSTYNVTSFLVHNNGSPTYQVSFVIGDNATISVVEELALYQVSLQVNHTGELTVQEDAYFEGGTVANQGHIKITGAEFSQVTVVGTNNATFHFDSFDFENGTIVVSDGNFTSSDTEFELSTINFMNNAPNLGEVDFESVDAQFPVGFYAEEQFVISSSNFTAYFPDALANVSFILAGKNNLTISNLNFNSDKIKINNTGTPYVTFNVKNAASFDGNLTIPGDIIIDSFSNVNFNGTIDLSGGLTADGAFTQIRTAGALKCGGPISLIGSDSSSFTNNSLTVSNAIITAPSIKVERFVIYSRQGITIINSSLINNGSIHIFESSSVIVQGNYTQLPNTTFGAFNLDNTRDRLTNLVVNGTAYIDGDIKYNTSETKNRFTATVIQATYLQGNFSTSQFYGNVDQFKPKLNYTANAVQISINPDQKGTPSWQGIHWWVWLLIGIAALAVVIGLIVLVQVVRRRRRAKYQPVY